MGYRRPDGPPGARNHLVVVSAMDNANPLARRIGKLVREAVVVNTTFGRNLFGEDERQHYRVMGRTAGHPNVGAAIVVSLEPKSAQDVADVAAEASPWMPVETLTIHETGGTLRTASRGVEIAQKLYRHLSTARRRRCDLSELTLGTECGGSDTTSGLVANPVTGVLADRIVDAGRRRSLLRNHGDRRRGTSSREAGGQPEGAQETAERSEAHDGLRPRDGDGHHRLQPDGG